MTSIFIESREQEFSRLSLHVEGLKRTLFAKEARKRKKEKKKRTVSFESFAHNSSIKIRSLSFSLLPRARSRWLRVLVCILTCPEHLREPPPKRKIATWDGLLAEIGERRVDALAIHKLQLVCGIVISAEYPEFICPGEREKFFNEYLQRPPPCNFFVFPLFYFFSLLAEERGKTRVPLFVIVGEKKQFRPLPSSVSLDGGWDAKRKRNCSIGTFVGS